MLGSFLKQKWIHKLQMKTSIVALLILEKKVFWKTQNTLKQYITTFGTSAVNWSYEIEFKLVEKGK